MSFHVRYSLRTLLLLVAIGPVVLSGLVYVPQMIWDGRFALNVRFVNETGKTIDRIDAAAVIKREYADFHVAHPNVEEPRWRTFDLDDNGVAQIDVNCSGHVSQFTGIELSYMQFEAIVVRVEFTDGSQSLFAANIPERGKRHLDVDIPTPK
jgi:hypothetical protein